MKRSSIKFILPFLIGLLPMAHAQQLSNTYTCGPGPGYVVEQAECDAGCLTSDGSPPFADSQVPGGGANNNNNYSGVIKSIPCKAPQNSTGITCSPVSYFSITEDDQLCGFCPDCGNQNCGNYQYPGCCDQTNAALECGPGAVCSSCENACIIPGPQGTACCPAMQGSDCAGNLWCDCNSTCEPPGQIGDPCTCDGDCSGGLECLFCMDSFCASIMVCGCSDPCDDPRCDPNYTCDCTDACDPPPPDGGSPGGGGDGCNPIWWNGYPEGCSDNPCH